MSAKRSPRSESPRSQSPKAQSSPRLRTPKPHHDDEETEEVVEQLVEHFMDDIRAKFPDLKF